MEKENDHVFAGAGFIFLAAVAYAAMGALVKFGKNISDSQLVFFRNFVCLLFLLPWIFLPKKKSLKTSVFSMHFIRACAGLLNMYCFFYSIRYIILTDAMLLNNTMPLFLPLVLWIWKGEKIPLKLLPGLGVGFLGVVLILHPGLGILKPAAIAALLSGMFMSISMAGIRELGKFEPLYRILFYYFAIASLISAVPLFWTLENHSLILWIVLIGVGVFAALYQFFLTKGYNVASATKISPVIYFAVVVSGLFDWIFWKVVPPYMSYIGVFFVIIGAIYCMRVEAKTE